MSQMNSNMDNEKSKDKGAVHAISTVMMITLAGKLLGLLRDRLLAVNYGTGMYANAFLTASRIPRVFFDIIFASAIAASFIPVYSTILKKRGIRDANLFGSNFITVIGLATLLLTILGMIFTKPLVELFADGYDAETAALAGELTKIMFPTVFFTGIAYSFVGILQSLDEFNIPAFISLISNVIIIAYYIVLNKNFGIYGLAIAFLIGWLMQALVQIPALRRKGFSYKLGIDLKSKDMGKVLTLMLPVMVSTWVQPINLTINTKFASHLEGGSGVSAIEYSTNLYLIIIGVFILSVTNVIFPKLSRQSIDEDDRGFTETVSKTMHSSMFFMLPMMCGVMCLSRPLINLIYSGGEFTAEDVSMTEQAMFFVTLGMPGYGIQNILSRVFFAKLDGKTPLVAGAISIGINILLCIILIKPLGVAGLAISAAVASTVNGGALAIALEIKGKGYHSPIFIMDIIKMIISSIIMSIAVIFTRNFIVEYTDGILGKLLTLFMPTVVGILVYFIATLVLKLEETQMIVKLSRKGWKETL